MTETEFFCAACGADMTGHFNIGALGQSVQTVRCSRCQQPVEFRRVDGQWTLRGLVVEKEQARR